MNLLSQVKVKSFGLNLYYQVGDFLQYDLASENFGKMFLEIANNGFGLYEMYLEIFSRVYFNELKQITEIILFNIFLKKDRACACEAKRETDLFQPQQTLLSAWEEIVKISQRCSGLF